MNNPMNFIELAQKRYSCRKYKSQAVEDEKLGIVLEAGRIAPSAVNYQPWIFVVVKDENVTNLQSCYHREWFKSAPVYIVICANHSQSWKRYDDKDHADIDIAIAADHMTLAATSLGLATCWVCNFNKEDVVKTIGLPTNYEAVVILPIGYPDDIVNENRYEEKRKKLDEIVFYEKFS
jgi:nitroreductase